MTVGTTILQRRGKGLDGSQVTHCVALVLTLFFYVVIIAWITSLAYDSSRSRPTEGLQVVWIEASKPEIGQLAAIEITTPVLQTMSVSQEGPRTLHEIPESDQKAVFPPLHDTETANYPEVATSEALLQEARSRMRNEVETDFKRNPLTYNPPPLTGLTGRSLVREPLSVAKVMEGVGRIFGGPDYEQSPCPRIHRNIAALGTGGRSAALDEEISRFQQHCM